MQNHLVTACFSEQRINLQNLQATFSTEQIKKREGSFVLIKLATKKYIYVKDYGGIVFFGVGPKEQDSILKQIDNQAPIKLTDHKETINVVEGSETIEVSFDVIRIVDLDLETIHIICLNLCQSVALFYYKELTDGLSQTTHLYTKELESTGKVPLRRKKLLKFIGSTLNIKNKISENLYVFDTPMIAWDDKNISKIDSKLNEELEIKYRYNAIKEQLNIVKDNLDLFKDLNLHQHSSLLEWIIIWLILFEVIHVIIDQLI